MAGFGLKAPTAVEAVARLSSHRAKGPLSSGEFHSYPHASGDRSPDIVGGITVKPGQGGEHF